MSYRLTIGLNLGSTKTDQNLRGQLLTPSGTTHGGAISSGFYEVGSGTYSFDHFSYPSDFRGLLSVYPSGGTYSAPYILMGINPEDAEYLDTKLSTLPSLINTTMSAFHGSGDWTNPATSNGVGSYNFDIYTKDESLNPVGGTRIAIYPSGYTNLIGYSTTNASTGKAPFNLDVGEYRVDAYKYGSVIYSNPNYITVSGSGSATIYGTTLSSIVVNPSGNVVRLYAYLADLGLNADDDCGDMIVRSSGTIDYGSYLITTKPIKSSPDSAGFVYADVATNVDVRVQIPKARFDKYLTTPMSGVLNLATLV